MRNFLIDTDTASDDAVAIIMALAEPNVRVLRPDDGRGQRGPRAGDPERAVDRRALQLRRSRLCWSGQAALSRARPCALVPRQRRHGRSRLPKPKRRPERKTPWTRSNGFRTTKPGLTLVTLGPLTNVALALKRDPKLAERIGRCVLMGGAPCCEGNVTPAAEYNIWVDPEAARAVFRSKLNIEMVGWHVSRGASVLRETKSQPSRRSARRRPIRHRVEHDRP